MGGVTVDGRILAAALEMRGNTADGHGATHIVTASVPLDSDPQAALDLLIARLADMIRLSWPDIAYASKPTMQFTEPAYTDLVNTYEAYTWVNGRAVSQQFAVTWAEMVASRSTQSRLEEAYVLAGHKLFRRIVRSLELAPTVIPYPGHHVDSTLDPPRFTEDVWVRPIPWHDAADKQEAKYPVQVVAEPST